MRVLIGPSILLCSFMSSAYGGAWVPEIDIGKLIANRIEISIERWDKPRPTGQCRCSEK